MVCPLMLENPLRTGSKSFIRSSLSVFLGQRRKMVFLRADPGFLERGLIHIYKCVGVCFADLISFSEISHENEIIWSQ